MRSRWRGLLPGAAVAALCGVVALCAVLLVAGPRAAPPAARPLPSGPTTTWTAPDDGGPSTPTGTPAPELSARPGVTFGAGPRASSRPAGTPRPTPRPGAAPPAPGVGPTVGPGVGPGVGGPTCLEVPRLEPVSVLSFNIHAGIGPRGADLPTIAAEIRASKADVVLLQEVDRFRPRTEGLDTPAWLARELGMYAAFGQNLSWARSGGPAQQYGLATLSRFPIAETQHFHLPNAAGGEQRGVLRTRVLVGGLGVEVLNTHLEHTSASLRSQQARAVAGLVERLDSPVLVGGDFNTTAGTDPYEVMTDLLLDGWLEAGSGDGRTVPRARIDFVFHDQDLVALGSSVLGTTVSDHRPLRVDLMVSGPPSCLGVTPR